MHPMEKETHAPDSSSGQPPLINWRHLNNDPCFHHEGWLYQYPGWGQQLLTAPWLYQDLWVAYQLARLHKRGTPNQLRFEINLEDNLYSLYQDLLHRHYTLGQDIAFVVEDPKVREIFAATFRDRVVHHLIYDLIAPYWEKRFIYDSYSCRPHKGTHFGIERVAKFLRQATHNYTRQAWVMKMDIKSYFMNIDRQIMWELNQAILQDTRHPLPLPVAELLEYLLPIVIFDNPSGNVEIRGSARKWDSLPQGKSLFLAREGTGFPIGNLTSQLFSNIYLHELDKFVKYKLRAPYYGRYVDDFVLVHPDKKWLLAARAAIADFLTDRLLLTVHPTKFYLQPARFGVSFVGALIRPHGMIPTARFRRHFARWREQSIMLDHFARWEAQLASFAGHDQKIRHCQTRGFRVE